MRRVFLLVTLLAGSTFATGASAQGGFYSATLPGAPAESELTTFMGYSEDHAGRTLAQFYDTLAQTVVVLDRQSLDQRVRNLKQQGLSADASEHVVRAWPPPRDAEY